MPESDRQQGGAMTVAEEFDRLDYGPAPEDASAALAMLAAQDGPFGLFVGGRFRQVTGAETFATENPATGAVLARITQAGPAEVDAAVKAARRAQKGWAATRGHDRARVLYALARLIQKHSRMLAVLETLDNGKPIREARDIDIPLAARHFYFHAGAAQLMAAEMPGRVPLGVCGQIIPWNFPLLMLAWKIAPALAMGNAVVLKPAEFTPLSALYFAGLCGQAGVPPGVVSILTGDGRTGAALAAHPGIDKIAFTGSTAVGRQLREVTAGTGKALTLELGGKSPVIVFEDADLDSAVEGIVDGLWFNQGEVCCAGSRLIVQEGVAERFHDKLKARMETLRVGDPLDKAIDVGAIVDPSQRERIAGLVAGAAGEGGTVWHAPAALPEQGCYYSPTLITGLGQSSPLMQEEIFGPVLVSATFRTPAEAVALANDSRYGLAASIWSETIGVALDVAPQLAAGVVWINGANMFDAAAPFGGLRESGFGREGGWEGLWAYTKHAGPPLPKLRPLKAAVARSDPGDGIEAIDRTHKHFIGGRQARPDGGTVYPITAPDGRLIGEAARGNRKDIRNAVEAARKAQGGWAARPGHGRAQILYYIAENLSARAAAFADRIAALTGNTADAAQAEVAGSIDRLFTWAAWADKCDGRVKDVPIRGLALALRRPVGVIGALCPEEAPLLGLISCLGPALALGNSCVLVPSGVAPLAATDFIQVLETSDVPAGTVNIVTGPQAELAPHLAGHMDVDACWCFGAAPLSAVVEHAAAGNLKRSWVSHGRTRDWLSPAAEGADFRDAATEVQTVWVPWGA
jgi:aldehyde dehydrogenase (NAD+)